jgi:hypothetical protein
VLIIERIHGVSEVPAMMGVLYIKEQPHLKKEKVCCWSIPFPPSLKWGECDVHRVDRVGRIYTRGKKLQAFFLPLPNERAVEEEAKPCHIMCWALGWVFHTEELRG